MKNIHTFGMVAMLAVLLGSAAKAEDLACYEVEFTSGASVHKGLLFMSGDYGVMRVRYYSEANARTEMVQMKMTLKASPRGLVIEGGVPIDTATGLPHPAYNADNFVLRTEPDGTKRVINVDDAGVVCETTSHRVYDAEAVTALMNTFGWKW